MIQAAIWFFLGTFCYALFSKLINFIHSLNFIKLANEAAFKMIGFIAEDLAYMRQLKHSQLKDCNLPEEQIKIIMDLEYQILLTWKQEVITKMLNSYPARLRNLIPFTDWNSAMKHLEKIYLNDRT